MTVLTGIDGGGGIDPQDAAQRACKILCRAADEALKIDGLSATDRGRILRIRRAYMAGARWRPLSLEPPATP